MLSKSVAASPVSSKSYFVWKRVLDVVVAFLALLIIAPLFLMLAVINRFGKPKGSLLYKQQRLGLNGQLFFIYKFRTMQVNADELLRANCALYEKYVANDYKLAPNEDPRLTQLGKFLRKTSLDELPQLWNVLKGEMSLVGPRPIVQEELGEYSERQQDFLSVKPGLTGYWQVNGRSEVGYPERTNLELYYVSNQSFLLDMKILCKTFYVVLSKKGAY